MILKCELVIQKKCDELISLAQSQMEKNNLLNQICRKTKKLNHYRIRFLIMQRDDSELC
jgi:hypothetical protein